MTYFVLFLIDPNWVRVRVRIRGKVDDRIPFLFSGTIHRSGQFGYQLWIGITSRVYCVIIIVLSKTGLQSMLRLGLEYTNGYNIDTHTL